MITKQTFKFICLSLIFFSTKFYGQSTDQKAKTGADFICECSKIALSENGVDTVKLLEIYNSYQSQGTLLSKYKSDVKRISSQMNSNYSAIESEIYKCRSQVSVRSTTSFTRQYTEITLPEKTHVRKKKNLPEERGNVPPYRAV